MVDNDRAGEATEDMGDPWHQYVAQLLEQRPELKGYTAHVIYGPRQEGFVAFHPPEPNIIDALLHGDPSSEH